MTDFKKGSLYLPEDECSKLPKVNPTKHFNGFSVEPEATHVRLRTDKDYIFKKKQILITAWEYVGEDK